MKQKQFKIVKQLSKENKLAQVGKPTQIGEAWKLVNHPDGGFLVRIK